MIYLITAHVLLQVTTAPRKSPEAAKVDPSRESRSAHKKKHSPEAFKSVKRSKSSLDEDKKFERDKKRDKSEEKRKDKKRDKSQEKKTDQKEGKNDDRVTEKKVRFMVPCAC